MILKIFLIVISVVAYIGLNYWFMLISLFILWDKIRRELDRLAKDEDRDIKAGLRAFNMFNYYEKLYKRCVFWGLGIWLPVNLATALIIYLL